MGTKAFRFKGGPASLWLLWRTDVKGRRDTSPLHSLSMLPTAQQPNCRKVALFHDVDMIKELRNTKHDQRQGWEAEGSIEGHACLYTWRMHQAKLRIIVTSRQTLFWTLDLSINWYVTWEETEHLWTLEFWAVKLVPNCKECCYGTIYMNCLAVGST